MNSGWQTLVAGCLKIRAGELVLDGACDAELELALACDDENAVSYQSDRNHLERNHPERKHPQWK